MSTKCNQIMVRPLRCQPVWWGDEKVQVDSVIGSWLQGAGARGMGGSKSRCRWLSMAWHMCMLTLILQLTASREVVTQLMQPVLVKDAVR